jgi:hypothetical protein
MEDYSPEEIERFKRRFAEEQGRQNVEAMTHSAQALAPVSSTPQARMYDPKTGTVGGEVNPLVRALMGVGAGVERSVSSLGELTGLVSPERYQQTQEQNEPFTQGPEGSAGQFVGETAATSLMGGPVGRALRMGGPAMRSAIESGVTTYATADPQDRRTEGAYGALAGGGLTKGGQALRGLTHGIDMSPAARRLTTKGVELSPGQIAPDSTWAMVEESMMNIPFIRPKVVAARQRGWQQTQELIGKEAAPPGYTPPSRADVRDTYNDLSNAYVKAYDQFKGYPLQPVLMRVQGGNVPLSQAMAIPRQAAADPKSRRYVQKEIDNELGRIQGRQLTSGNLLDIRSNIRAKRRDLAGNDNYPDAEKLLDATEKRITEVLESQLPADAMKALRAVDAKYGNFKVLEDAIVRSKDRPDAFTPAQFSMAVKESAGSKGQYAGGGGRMRDIAAESVDVFSPRTPVTGAQQPSQLVGYATAVPAAFVYSDQGRKLGRVLAGQTDVQRQIQDFERQFRRKLSAQEREDLARVLRMGASQYAAEEKPFFATTKEYFK